MTDVFTTYMSLEEAQHALGILEVQHLARIVQLHRRHAFLTSGILLFTTEGLLLKGAFVKQVASCPNCFVALTAARTDRTRHEMVLLVEDEVLFAPEEEEEEEATPDAGPDL